MGGDRRAYELIGWLLFAAGVVLFLIQGIRTRDPFTTGGSALFLAGIVAFLVPLFEDR
jgi:uncharacterized membrane protein YiaA